jgi:hypothetical protein
MRNFWTQKQNHSLKSEKVLKKTIITNMLTTEHAAKLNFQNSVRIEKAINRFEFNTLLKNKGKHK